MEVRPAYIIPTNRFLKGENNQSKALRGGLSAHLRYAFKFSLSSYVDRIYGGPYQGIGLAYYTFGNQKEIGNPATVYLLQGGSLARFDPRLALNYEWNFGLSSGWHPYDPDINPNNVIIGSKINAYLNTNLYLNWELSSRVDLTSGITLTHFSNGNTRFPNAGLNTCLLYTSFIGCSFNCVTTICIGDNPTLSTYHLYRCPWQRFVLMIGHNTCDIPS